MKNIERNWNDNPTIVDEDIELDCLLENDLAGLGTLIIDKDFIDDMETIADNLSNTKDLLSLTAEINNEVRKYFHSFIKKSEREEEYLKNSVVDENGVIIGTKASSLRGKGVAKCTEKSIAAYIILRKLYRMGLISRKPSFTMTYLKTKNSQEEAHAFLLLDKENCHDVTKHVLFDLENPTLTLNTDGTKNYFAGLYSLTDWEYNDLINGLNCTPKSLYDYIGNYKAIDEKRTYGNSHTKYQNLNYNEDTLESLGVIPFGLNKESLNGEYVASWTTSPKSFSDELKETPNGIINYVFNNTKRVGLDEMVMPDQTKNARRCHELTYEEVLMQYRTDTAHKQGTIWNVTKNYDSVFMTRETHYQIMEDFGKSISLVYPGADCAIVRKKKKKNDVIGLTHSDLNKTSTNLVGDMIEYMKEHFNSDPNDIVVFVGAFAREGMIWDKYPPVAANYPEEWEGYIKQIDDDHYEIMYGDKLYDQLVEDGLKPENIYFDSDNTITNEDYFSNNRIKLQNDRFGRNLFGISFDSLPIYESVENEESRTRFK